jgi:hypothetical protein
MHDLADLEARLLADGPPLTVAEFMTAVTNGTFMPDPSSARRRR